MKLTFDANLHYQQDAIKSITGLFKGQPMEDSILEFNVLSKDQILSNLQSIQIRKIHNSINNKWQNRH